MREERQEVERLTVRKLYFLFHSALSGSYKGTLSPYNRRHVAGPFVVSMVGIQPTASHRPGKPWLLSGIPSARVYFYSSEFMEEGLMWSYPVLPGTQNSPKTNKQTPIFLEVIWFFPFQWILPAANKHGCEWVGWGWPHLRAFLVVPVVPPSCCLRLAPLPFPLLPAAIPPLKRGQIIFLEPLQRHKGTQSPWRPPFPNVHLCNITQRIFFFYIYTGF